MFFIRSVPLALSYSMPVEFCTNRSSTFCCEIATGVGLAGAGLAGACAKTGLRQGDQRGEHDCKRLPRT